MALGPTQAATQLIAAGQYGDVGPQLDMMELQIADLDQWPHTLQLLGHIYNGSLEDARFAWKRASDTHKQTPELKASFAILQQLWNKNYQGVWPALTSFQWSESAEPLVLAIAQRQRQHAVQLISCAYSSIQPARLAALTGSSSEEALQIAQSQGWQLHGEVILVKRHGADIGSKAASDHLQHLAEFVVQLEA